jgi:hypothetical protein
MVNKVKQKENDQLTVPAQHPDETLKQTPE